MIFLRQQLLVAASLVVLASASDNNPISDAEDIASLVVAPAASAGDHDSEQQQRDRHLQNCEFSEHGYALECTFATTGGNQVKYLVPCPFNATSSADCLTDQSRLCYTYNTIPCVGSYYCNATGNATGSLALNCSNIFAASEGNTCSATDCDGDCLFLADVPVDYNSATLDNACFRSGFNEVGDCTGDPQTCTYTTEWFDILADSTEIRVTGRSNSPSVGVYYNCTVEAVGGGECTCSVDCANPYDISYDCSAFSSDFCAVTDCQGGCLGPAPSAAPSVAPSDAPSVEPSSSPVVVSAPDEPSIPTAPTPTATDIPAECELNSACNALNLTGICCPEGGEFLDCCYDTVAPLNSPSVAPSTAPSLAPSTEPSEETSEGTPGSVDPPVANEPSAVPSSAPAAAEAPTPGAGAGPEPGPVSQPINWGPTTWDGNPTAPTPTADIPAECELNSACKALNLTGICCPDGATFLDCCYDGEPTLPDEPVAECQSNSACKALNLTGLCCPTVDNWILDCCDGVEKEVTCELNEKCNELNLTGACCPTNTGFGYLDCCDAFPAEECIDGVCNITAVEDFLEFMAGGDPSAAMSDRGASGAGSTRFARSFGFIAFGVWYTFM